MSRVELLKNNPHKKFKLIGVNKINCLFPHRYKTTFKDIATNEEFETEILPEDLRGQYVLGNIYSEKGLIDKNNKTTKLYIPINKVTSENLRQINKCITHHSELGIDFYNELCLVYKTKNTIFLIPCYIIANRYYFLSTYIKTALSEGLLESLYYYKEYAGKGYKLENGRLEIELKATVSKEHAPLISRIISNDLSKNNFKYFFTQTSTYLQNHPNDPYKSIVMGFPFEKNEAIEIYSNYIDLGKNFYKDNMKTEFNERNVVLLTHIYKDKIPYNFTNLHYKYRKKEINDTVMPIEEEDQETDIPRENPKQSGRHTKSKPSKKYTPKTEVHQVENKYDFSDINISSEELTEKIEREIYDYNSNEEVDDSSEKPDKNNSSKNKIQKLIIKDSLKLGCFQINDFYKLIKSFIEEKNIQNYNISDIIDLENPENSKINKFFTDDEKELPRQIIFGYFIFDRQIVNFIEAEHNLYWEKNTWFFISNQTFTEIQVQNILNTNIIKNQSHKKMLESSKIYGALKFFSTQHEYMA